MKNTALKIVEVFQKAGYETYWAGGSVRDLVMGKQPQDYDIATSALPDQIEQIVRKSHLLSGKTIDLGRSFGVMMAIVDGHHFEIATFRSDSDLSDGRRPDAVLFSNPKEDAKRRDFTINGMFYDPLRQEVIDYVGGQQDIKIKLIRFIGDPDQRIQEDYLRLLRAARFKFTFGFTYEHRSFRAIRQSAHFITKTAHERVHDEISKMLKAGRKHGQTADLVFQELDHTGLLKEILPEVEALKYTIQPAEYHAEGDVFMHTLRCLRALHPQTPEVVVWAVLLHDIGKPVTQQLDGGKLMFRGHEKAGVEIADQILSRLHFKRAEKEHILWLIEHHMMLLGFDRMREAKRLKWFMDVRFEDLLQVLFADSVGTSPTNLTAYNHLEEQYNQAREQKLLLPPDKLVTGNDIMEHFGLLPGEKVGFLMEIAHDAQLEGLINSKQEALDLLGDYIDSN